MFTGIVQDLGRVVAVDSDNDGARISILTSLAEQLSSGDSIAVNGCCLTAVGESVTTSEGTIFVADVMLESLRRTSLGQAAQPEAVVNLELAMTPATHFGGHIVQGHVDGTAKVSKITEDGFSRIFSFELSDPSLLRYVVEKGSITLDGVSLTVSALDATSLSVSLIPETQEHTTFSVRQEGDIVNVEVDVLAKHVEKLLQHQPRS